LRNRILVALAAIPVILLTVLERSTNGWPFLFVMLIAGLLCVMEYMDLVGERFSRYSRTVSIVSTLSIIGFWYLYQYFTSSPLFIFNMAVVAFVVAFVPLVLLFLGVIFRDSFEGALQEVAFCYLPVLYIGIGFGSLIGIRGYATDTGPYLVLYAFLVVWATDSFALIIGKLIGRHKLGLAVSPNKTGEGLAGGVFFALLTAVLFKIIGSSVYTGKLLFQWPVFLAVTLFLSLADQIGDLAESVLKRSVGVKDSGGSIPGHGGWLDVFDAQLFVSPLFFALVVLLYR